MSPAEPSLAPTPAVLGLQPVQPEQGFANGEGDTLIWEHLHRTRTMGGVATLTHACAMMPPANRAVLRLLALRHHFDPV